MGRVERVERGEKEDTWGCSKKRRRRRGASSGRGELVQSEGLLLQGFSRKGTVELVRGRECTRNVSQF